MTRSQSTGRRRRAGQARPPARRVASRLTGRLPSAGRIGAIVLFTLLVGGFVTLINGPWLRVARVAVSGAHFTPSGELDALLASQVGASILTVDSGTLAARLRELPAVAAARVGAELPDRVVVSLSEKAPALTWQTRGARLVVAADGTVIAAQPLDAVLSADLAGLPGVDDQRSASRTVAAGDVLPATELAAAQRLLALPPEQLGSRSRGFTLQVDDEYGFVLVSARPAWRLALGFYQLDPTESEGQAVARLAAQAAAVRTLFDRQAEGRIGWVDARNPGKVYWAR